MALEDINKISNIINIYNIDTLIYDMDIQHQFYEHSNSIVPEMFIEPVGIHGISHAKRVLLLSLILSSVNNLVESDKMLLVEASKYHDIGRVNDRICELHGYFSFKKMIDLKLLRNTKVSDIETLKYIIKNHCIDDKNAFKHISSYGIRDKDRAISLLKLFKDADALDRVRTNDIDISYLRFAYSKQLLRISEQLFNLF